MSQDSEVLARFLKLTRVNTRSKPDSTDKPSSKGQIELANMLKEEIRGFGHTITEFKDGSFLVEVKPSNPKFENAPHVVFAAHMDTYYGYSGATHAQVIQHPGGDLVVNERKNIVIPAKDLEGIIDQLIVVSDGNSVLGADDKAGIAVMMEILSLIEYIDSGPVSFWFCVDEEIGALDVSVIPEETVKKWDILWTLDGERLNSIDVGCFMGRKIDITIKGTDAHPGVSGDKLKPALYAAINIAKEISDLPSPMETIGDEGFFYITEMSGNAAKAKVTCMPRNFEESDSKAAAIVVDRIARSICEKHGVEVEIDDKVLYINTRVPIEKKKHLLQPGIDALKELGFDEVPFTNVRGGTDGAMINMVYPELPAPNLGTGAKNLHGPMGFLVVDELKQLVTVVHRMIEAYKDM